MKAKRFSLIVYTPALTNIYAFYGRYWQLGEGSTMRDVIAQVRADESHHRDVNHKFAHIVPKAGTVNPFQPGH